MLVKDTVAEPLAERAVSKARALHVGVELALSAVIVVAILLLHEMRKFAPFDFSVTHERVMGVSDIMRPVASDAVNEVVTGSGMTLVSTDTVRDFDPAPLYTPGAIAGSSVSVMLLETGELLSNTRERDPDPARSPEKIGVLQGRYPAEYEGDVVRI